MTTTTNATLRAGQTIEADVVTGGQEIESVYRGGQTTRCRGLVVEAGVYTAVVLWQDGPAAGRQFALNAQIGQNVFPTSNVTVLTEN